MKKILLSVILLTSSICSKAVDSWTIVDSCSFLYITYTTNTFTFIYKPNKQNIALSFDTTYFYVKFHAPYFLNQRTLKMNEAEITVPTVSSSTDAFYQVYNMITDSCLGPPGPIGPTGPTGATGATGFVDIDSCYTRIQADTIGCGTSLIVDAPSGTTFNGDVSLSGNELFAGTVHVHTRFDIGDLAHDHHLTIGVAEDFTADRILNLFLSDASRNLTIDGDAIISGDNNGDVTLAGTPDYITIAGQVITRNKLDLVDDLNTFSSANLATNLTDETGSGLAVFNNTPFFLDDIVIGTPATATGQALFRGTTSGTVTLSVADAAGTWTIKLPVDDGDASEFLQTDGSGNTSWQPGGSTSPGGANTNVQYNDGGVFGGESDFTWTKATNTLQIGNALGTSGYGKLNLEGDSAYVIYNGGMASTQVIGTDFQHRNATEYSYDAPVVPSANGGTTLGTTTVGWGGLRMSTGSTVNFANGNWVLTHSSGIGTVSTGDLRVTTAGTNAASVLTVNGVQPITGVKTFSDDIFQLNNPAATFQYIFSTSALAADRTITYPLLEQDERAAVEPYNAQLTGDQTSVSTSLADVPGMTISLAASTEYNIFAELQVTTNATTVGILCTFNHSTAVTSIRFLTSHPISATAWFNEQVTALDGGTLQTAGPGATVQTLRMSGTIVTNTAGTLALRFRSETGAAAVVKAGSWIKVERTN